MYYLNVNILLTILSYQCLTTCVFGQRIGPSQTYPFQKPVNKNCVLWIPYDGYRMPIPYASHGNYSAIINSDTKGNIELKPGETIKFTCTKGTRFTPNILTNNSDITVKCLHTLYLDFNGSSHKFIDIKCAQMPKPNLRVTNTTCQTKNGIVIEAGFQTMSEFLLSYRICHDVRFKNTLYTWYNIKSPYYLARKLVRLRPIFINGTQLVSRDVGTVYKTQTQLLEEILNSKTAAQKYIKPEVEFLSRGHLVARTEFNYIFEQLATFFYENTAPQWHSFNIGIWRDLEQFFRDTISSRSNSRHLIIAGTYGKCKLPDEQGVQRPLYLILPDSMKVPRFIWKMNYDIYSGVGMVFIGMNNPYAKIDNSSYFCETVPCPNSIKMSHTTKLSLLYCCTKESFEKVYGQLDDVVFQNYR